jgi:hypothetical protein
VDELGVAGPGSVTMVAGGRLWMPDGDAKIYRCFIYGSSGPHFRVVARLNHCVLFSPDVEPTDFAGSLKEVLGKVAASGHPEGPKLMGLGSGYSAVYGTHARRVRATPDAWLGGTGGGVGAPDGDAFVKTPWLDFNGACDGGVEAAKMSWLESGVTTGALRTTVVIWNQSHLWGIASNVTHPFYHQLINKRVPKKPVVAADGSIGVTMPKVEDGWLVDFGSVSSTYATIGPHATFTGDRKRAGWVSDRFMAHVWRAMVSRKSPVSITDPAPGASESRYFFRQAGTPFDVTVAVAGKPGAYPALLDASGAVRPKEQIALEGRASCRSNVPWTQEMPRKVTLMSGDMKLAELSAPPYKFAGIKLRAGVHGLIAEAEYADGSKSVSLPTAAFITNWAISDCVVNGATYDEQKACPTY